MTILVTGAKGMIGSRTVTGLLDAGYQVVGVDVKCENLRQGNYVQYRADLADREKLWAVIRENRVDRVVHLAALAHTYNESDLSWERYYHINVECAQNVFDAAGDRPVLFISTVDVFGFYDGKKPVNGKTEPHPVSNYGKSKAEAEEACKKLKHYTIFRFSPVYTDTIKRDIQKRYYLKYPTVAYRVGKGTNYEILDIKGAVAGIVDWCAQEPRNEIQIIKDPQPMWTPDYIKAEKEAGRAKVVLWFPRWMVLCGYTALKRILGENDKTFLLNKVIHPLKSK